MEKGRLHDGAENMGLDWIGMVPGKRESRRLVGDYLLTLNDVLANQPFPDCVLYGGWFLDIHTMGGILAKGEPGIYDTVNTNEDTIVRTYSIPYRCLYSRNIGNLFMAGRDVSVTHCALGTTRLMLTCAMMGQVVGTAAASDNYHRRRIHRFRAVRSRKLRITVLATNGDPSARIFEVRAYQEE